MRLLAIITFFIISSEVSFGQKEIFIKKIDFVLHEISDKDYENEYFMTMKFNKGTTYKFVVTNGIDNITGEAVLELLDGDKLQMTNLIGDKYFPKFSFQCNKTDFYDILVRFKDNQLGHSTIDIFLLQ